MDPWDTIQSLNGLIQLIASFAYMINASQVSCQLVDWNLSQKSKQERLPGGFIYM